MPYDTLISSGHTHVPTFPIHQSQPKRGVSSPGFIFLGSLIDRDHVGYCVPLCVWFGTGLWGFYFLNHICFWAIKVWCHVAGSQKGVDRRCYDWTETNLMFRLLIGICGSHLSWYTEPFPAITCFSCFKSFSKIIVFWILCSEGYYVANDDCFCLVGITGWISFWCQFILAVSEAS